MEHTRTATQPILKSLLFFPWMSHVLRRPGDFVVWARARFTAHSGCSPSAS